ncbi:MAG: class I SAM-dependent methyltransferase [Pseudomonadales bacterium]
MDVKEESILGPEIETHWYYVSKGRALLALLGDIRAREVLDVGAGSGIFARQLLEADVCGQATCVDPAYSNSSVKVVNGRELRFTRTIDRPSQDLILMMDVLEHVPDDVALLRQYTASLSVDGHVAITVPAFPALWSGHDVFLEHYRRYTRPSLEAVVRAAGLEVVQSRYFFGLLLPMAAVTRLLAPGRHQERSALRKCHPILNRGLIWLHDVERRLIFPYNSLGGLSLFCLARPG